MNVKETVRLDNDDMFIVIGERKSEKQVSPMRLYIKYDILGLFTKQEGIILEGEKVSRCWGYSAWDHKYVNCMSVSGTNEEILAMAKNRLRNARDIIKKELNSRKALPETTVRLSDL